MATPTKATAGQQEWLAVTAASGHYGSDIDVSGVFKAGLAVVVCPTEAVAHELGASVFVEGRFGGDDEYWRTLYELRMGAGTAVLEAVQTQAEPTDTTIQLASTTGFETWGDKYFILNTTIANSELIRNHGFVDDDELYIVDGLTNQQATSSTLYSIVAEKYFPLPDELSTARVIVVNDDADCDVAYRVDLISLASIA